MENSLEQKVERKEKKPGKLRQFIGRTILAGALGLAGLVGVNGCAVDKVEFIKRDNSISFRVNDKDGIKRAYIVDEQGNVIYDALKELRRDEEPFSFSLPSAPSEWISAYLSNLFPRKDDGLTRKINYTDYSEKPFGLDLNGDYTLVVEDNKGNIISVPLEDLNQPRRCRIPILKDMISWYRREGLKHWDF